MNTQHGFTYSYTAYKILANGYIRQ